MTYQANSTEDVWGLALNLYGNAAGIAWLLEDNPTLVDGDGLAEVASQIVQVRKAAAWSKERFADPVNGGERVVRQSECLATSFQTLWDVALQQYGSAEGVRFLLADNSGLIESNGLVQDGRRQYKLRSEFLNLLIRGRMLEVIPSTGLKNANEEWVTDDGQPWVTDDGWSWVTG